MRLPRVRFTIRALMLFIAFSALMLAGRIAIWEWVELSRGAQFPWRSTQAAAARTRHAALATVNERAETRLHLQTSSPEALTPNRASHRTRPAESVVNGELWATACARRDSSWRQRGGLDYLRLPHPIRHPWPVIRRSDARHAPFSHLNEPS
jgi:hypothetical protein